MNDLTKELSQNFINYAMAVNTDRSIPDAKSGLKPVAKRILYAAYAAGYTSNKKHVKNATIVGEVIGKYHPHGDSSVYGALVRLSQEWTLRYPLIDFHGNKGNIAGDGPAAYRYTEGRLSKIAEDGLLYGLKKRVVPFVPTFDESHEEPATFPAIFPNLLCNPNTGIGVAMASNWAPHNLNEVAQAIYDYMDGKIPMLPGPDFPTGGEVINKDAIPDIMSTGRGSVKVRGRYTVEKNKIIFYELPYGVMIENLLSEIGKLNENGDLDEIEEVQDQSNKKGLRIVFECAKGADPYYVVNKLFAKTALQTSFSYNQVALVDGQPKELNLTDCCQIYVQHNIDCLLTEAHNDLKTAADRVHVIDGLLIALEDIDNVINLIKNSANSADAKVKLMNKYQLDEVQAKAILAMRLSSLAHMEKIELENEKKELIELINQLNTFINSETLQKEKVKERLNKIVEKFGDPRRTVLSQIATPKTKEEKEIATVPPEKCVVIMTEGGSVKRVPTSNFRTQRRNGKGVKTQDDITTAIIRTDTVDSLMVFTNMGKMYRILVNDIPVGTNTSKSQALKTLITMDPNEEPEVIYSLYRDTDAKFVLFATKNGLIKKTSLDEYTKTRKKTGIAAIGFKPGDSLASVSLIKDEDLLILTKKGMVIKIKSTDISPTGKTAMGVKGISLKEDDEVLTCLPIRDTTDTLALFSENGLGKRVQLNEITLQNRAGKGVVCSKDILADATLLNENDTILVNGANKSICIVGSEVPELGRAAGGNQIIKDSKIMSVSKV